MGCSCSERWKIMTGLCACTHVCAHTYVCSNLVPTLCICFCMCLIASVVVKPFWMQGQMGFIWVAGKVFPKVKDSNAIFRIYSKSVSFFLSIFQIYHLKSNSCLICPLHTVSNKEGPIWPWQACSSVFVCLLRKQIT